MVAAVTRKSAQALEKIVNEDSDRFRLLASERQGNLLLAIFSASATTNSTEQAAGGEEQSPLGGLSSPAANTEIVNANVVRQARGKILVCPDGTSPPRPLYTVCGGCLSGLAGGGGGGRGGGMRSPRNML